jgi:hypothetical protein
MKTLSPKLSKRLNDLWLLDDIETEYRITETGIIENNYTWIMKNFENYKTLTLEEAIEFLYNNKIQFNYILCWVNYKHNITEVLFNKKMIEIEDDEWWIFVTSFYSNISLLEVIEQMIEYLLDNNLLTN